MSSLLIAVLVVAVFGSPLWLHVIALAYLMWRYPGFRPWTTPG